MTPAPLQNTPPKLAVVIPAYKETFFSRTLESLAAQTDRDFKIYIGDDCSPHDLKKIADRFSDRLRISYTRFTTNIGAKHLVKQWERCMTLVQDEDWVWFFSDDDLASPNCVEVLRNKLKTTNGDVYRFNTCVIDGNDQLLWPTVPGPDFESAEQMALNILLGKRGNSMPDHVFSTDVYARKGGFVYTPYAQAADWATSIRFAQDKGMHIVQDGLVSWRLGSTSISSTVSKNRPETMLGHYCFIEWVLGHFKYLQTSPGDVNYEQIRAAALINLKTVIVYHYKGLPPTMYWSHLRFLRRHFDLPWTEAMRHLASIVTWHWRHRPH